MAIKEGLAKLKDGLPKEVFAIVGDPEDPETWKLPHHKKTVFRALQGKLDIEKTVDWTRMPSAVAAYHQEVIGGRGLMPVLSKY